MSWWLHFSIICSLQIFVTNSTVHLQSRSHSIEFTEGEPISEIVYGLNLITDDISSPKFAGIISKLNLDEFLRNNYVVIIRRLCIFATWVKTKAFFTKLTMHHAFSAINSFQKLYTLLRHKFKKKCNWLLSK